MLTFLCEMDLACTYAMRRPRLAAQCAARALLESLRMRRPDLTYKANALLGALR